MAYTSQAYSEAMDMWPDVSYIPYSTSSREKTGNVITSAQFEEGNLLSETRSLLSETCGDKESGTESDDN